MEKYNFSPKIAFFAVVFLGIHFTLKNLDTQYHVQWFICTNNVLLFFENVKNVDLFQFQLTLDIVDVVMILSVEGDLVVTGSDPPEQAPVPGAVIPKMTTAKMTLAIALIVTRKL